MPCVCLSNTFRQWASYKAQKALVRKLKLARNLAVRLRQRRLAWQAERSVISEATLSSEKFFAAEQGVMHIPHPRPKISTVPNTSEASSQEAQASFVVPKPRMADATLETPVENFAFIDQTNFTRQYAPNSVLQLPQLPLKPGASRADLINAESSLGRQMFGPIPYGHHREFFHDQNNVWIWHEDWQDYNAEPQELTVRYEVRTTGVYKKVSAGKYLRLEGEELENFRTATHTYLYLVKKYLYPAPQATNAA